MKIKIFILAALIFLFGAQFAFSQETRDTDADNGLEVYMFVQQGCPHCARAEKQFEDWKKSKYPEIEIKKFDIVEKENLLLFLTAQQAYGIQSQGVPTIFIGEKSIIGERYEETEEAIKLCREQTCPKPSEIIQNYVDRQTAANQATLDQIFNNQDRTDNTSRNIITAGIVIIGIICIFIIYRIMGKKKNA